VPPQRVRVLTLRICARGVKAPPRRVRVRVGQSEHKKRTKQIQYKKNTTSVFYETDVKIKTQH